jgi:hypothetical protein
MLTRLQLDEPWQHQTKVKLNSWVDQMFTLAGDNTLTGSNTFTGATTFTAAPTITIPSGTTALTLQSATANAPVIDISNTATGVTSTEIGQINFNGKDDAGNVQTYNFIDSIIGDATNGSEDGTLRVVSVVNGALVAVLIVRAGLAIGSPAGGDKGAGTLNLDNALYKDGTQVVSDRVTGWAAATNTKSKATFDTTTVTLPNLAARVGQLIDDLIAHGLIGP